MLKSAIFLAFMSMASGLCPLIECDCNDDELRVECVGMGLRELPITLNPHISTLRIRESQFKKLDAALQFYPHLKVITYISCAIFKSHKDCTLIVWNKGCRDGSERTPDHVKPAYLYASYSREPVQKARCCTSILSSFEGNYLYKMCYIQVPYRLYINSME